MKFLIICLFVVVAVAVTNVCGNSVLGTYALGTLIQSGKSSPPICTKTGPECTVDCTRVMLCTAFSPDPIGITTCTAPNQYCVNGACTSNPGLNCKVGGAIGDSGFKCTGEGLFPEPSDCTRYHVCDTGIASDMYQCGTGFVFNSQLSMCQLGKTPCTKISCAKATDANPFVLYTSNPAFYAFCMKNDKGVFEAIMFKCPNEEVFDLKAKACQYKCKAKGNFQNPLECGQYYSCTGVNAQPILASCPENWVFDGTGCNKNPDACQFTTAAPTTTTTTTPDPLSEEKPAAGSNVQDMVDALKVEIITKICAIDTLVQSDPDICPTTGSSAEPLTAINYKTEVDVPGVYFVRVQIKTLHYHIKILEVSPKPEVKGAVGSKDVTEDILYFDDN